MTEAVADFSRRARTERGWWVAAGLVVFGLLYPFLVETLQSLPVIGNFVPTTGSMVVMLILTMMALGLNIVVGYAGLLDLGYVAFYAAGAYVAAWLASLQFDQVTVHIGSAVDGDLPGIHISMWLVLIAAGVFTTIVGILIGLPTLRLRGDYLAIVTLGFGEIVPQFVRNADSLGGFDLTNGTFGITPIDSLAFGGFVFREQENKDDLYFWTAIGLILFTVFCCIRLRDSRLGRAWIAIREDEIAAAAMGVPLMRTKTWAYATGAFFGGIAGAYYASYKSATFPDDFFFNISVFILCMIILGGMGSIPGVIFGACFLSYLDREGLANIGGWMNQHFGPGGSVGEVWSKPLDVPLYEFGIFGLILVVVMLFRPEGLIPSERRKAEFHEGVHDQPLYDVVHE